MNPDIDIDLMDRNAALEFIPHIPASMVEKNTLKKHNVGIYLQNIPMDEITGLSSIPYKEAQSRGYFKIDMLNLSLYEDIKTEEHLIKLMNDEPYWEILEQKELVEQLFHISNHFDIVNAYKPKSIMELSMVLAIIRPAKSHLIGKTFDEIKDEIWINDNDKFGFKKSHAVAYANVIMVQMNLMMETAELSLD